MPAFFRRLRARVKYWNNAEELKKEIDAHRELASASFAADGVPDRESRWKAARLLGNTTMAREDARAVWIAQWVEHVIQDTRYTLRSLRREWAFAITASITLAVGLGVLVGVFTVFNAIFLRPWPVRAPSEVFGVLTGLIDPLPKDGNGAKLRISYAVWRDIRPQIRSADLAVKYDLNQTFRPASSGPGRALRFAFVNAEFLDTIGIGFQVGSLPDGGNVPGIAITDEIWRSTYGSDPAVAGKNAWLGELPVVITGVLDAKFAGFPPMVHGGVLLLNDQARGWLTKNPGMLTDPKQCCVEVFGRRRAPFTFAQIGEEITLRVNAVHEAAGLPRVTVDIWDTAMASKPGGVKRTVPTLFALLFTGCAIVTLLACANIGNLQLARGLRRSREVAVRLSIGASRSRVIRQFLTESMVITAIGALGGLLIAWTVPAAIMSADGATSLVYRPDARVILFAVAIAATASVLSGLAPALRVTRIDWRGAGGTVAPGATRLRSVLLATQVALSFGLIASASLLAHGALRAAGGAEAGFEFRNIHGATVAVDVDRENSKATHAAVKAAIEALPGVALADQLPWSGRVPIVELASPGNPTSVMGAINGFNQNAARLLELPLLDGRWHSDDARLREAVVSRSVARRLWKDEHALGRLLMRAGETTPYTVVGIIDEIQLVDATARPSVIVAPARGSLPEVIGLEGIAAQLKAVAAAVDPGVRVLVRPLIEGLKKQTQNSFMGASIASGLGVVSLLLASLGVFGVFAYVVEERRRDIGVRLALGANRSHVRRSIIGATRWPVTGGLAAGLVLAVIGGFLLRGNLYGLSVLDPLSYLAVTAILGFAALTATFIPLRRAIRVDPVVTLRQQ